MLKLALLILAILTVAMLFLCVNLLFRGGKFRSLHIGQSPEMRSRGIHCVQSMDAIERRKNPHQVVERERGKQQKQTYNIDKFRKST